jgi:hypothetical protein
VHADDAGLLGRVDDHELRAGAGDDGAPQAAAFVRIVPVVDANQVLAQVDHQLRGTVRENALPGMGGGVAVADPDCIHMLQQRRHGNVCAKNHRLEV